MHQAHDRRGRLLARWLTAPQELPMGVLTALLGGGYLLWHAARGRAVTARRDGPAGAAGIDAGAGARVGGDAVAIEARGVGVALGGVEVLHDVDLALAAGRWSAVVGPNGAGKSTLLRVLAGLQAGHRGEVRLGGASLAALAGRELARRLSWLGQGGGGDAGAYDLRVLNVGLLLPSRLRCLIKAVC